MGYLVDIVNLITQLSMIYTISLYTKFSIVLFSLYLYIELLKNDNPNKEIKWIK
jgi:hypothetical protein